MLKLFFIIFSLFFSINVYAEDYNTKKSLDFLKQVALKRGAPRIEGMDKIADKNYPVLYFGDKKVNNNYDLVDQVKKKMQGTATIFVKDKDEFVRVSTNVLTADGLRAIGTMLARNKAYEAVIKGETFCGKVKILNDQYNTCYEPIKNENEVIGIYYVGYKEN